MDDDPKFFDFLEEKADELILLFGGTGVRSISTD